MVRVSPDGGSSYASPVSSGGASAMPFIAPIGPASRPAVIRRAAAVQSLSIWTSRSRSLVITSNATKCSRSCAGVTMPAWCSPSNGYAPSVPISDASEVNAAPAMPAAPAAPATPAPASAMARRRDIRPVISATPPRRPC
jgi:hypothetical protein